MDHKFEMNTYNFILPEDKRPCQVPSTTSIQIPIIDLSDRDKRVKEIAKACEEYGFFQVINHGVPQGICDRVMTAVTDFFELPCDERARFFSTDPAEEVRLYNYYLKDNDVGDEKKKVINMWSQSFSHHWHPENNDFTRLLPTNPPQYKEAFSEYAKEIGDLSNKILSLISEGLGLEKDSLQKKMGEDPTRKSHANYYPPCPNPELTLGLSVHTDATVALTVLRQSEGVTGLQVIKDGDWISVDPVPNTFVINLGDQLQIMSNGRYKSVHHRAVTNRDKKRVSLAMFCRPNENTLIGPIDELVDDQHPPLYRHFRFSEFLQNFFNQEGTRRRVCELFELQV
ncbi:hypothetical protein ACFE04_011984 [Oxalis oulophora]